MRHCIRRSVAPPGFAVCGYAYAEFECTTGDDFGNAADNFLRAVLQPPYASTRCMFLLSVPPVHAQERGTNAGAGLIYRNQRYANNSSVRGGENEVTPATVEITQDAQQEGVQDVQRLQEDVQDVQRQQEDVQDVQWQQEDVQDMQTPEDEVRACEVSPLPGVSVPVSPLPGA